MLSHLTRVPPTETEGMRPLVLARLESPAQASVEGDPSCAVRSGSTATVPRRSKCVVVHSCPPTPEQGQWTKPAKFGDEAVEEPRVPSVPPLVGMRVTGHRWSWVEWLG